MNKPQAKRAPAADDGTAAKSNLPKDKAKRAPRGHNQFSLAALRRAVKVAREAGVDRVEIEIPGQSRITLTGIAGKQADEKPENIVALLK
jgi:hypothetical protein